MKSAETVLGQSSLIELKRLRIQILDECYKEKTKEINFSGRKLTKKFLDAFDHVMINDQIKIKRLICTSCGLSTQKIIDLFDNLADLKSLTDIDLGGNSKLTLQAARAIGKVVKLNHGKLVSLCFDNMMVSHKETIKILIPSKV